MFYLIGNYVIMAASLSASTLLKSADRVKRMEKSGLRTNVWLNTPGWMAAPEGCVPTLPPVKMGFAV